MNASLSAQLCQLSNVIKSTQKKDKLLPTLKVSQKSKIKKKKEKVMIDNLERKVKCRQFRQKQKKVRRRQKEEQDAIRGRISFASNTEVDDKASTSSTVPAPLTGLPLMERNLQHLKKKHKIISTDEKFKEAKQPWYKVLKSDERWAMSTHKSKALRKKLDKREKFVRQKITKNKKKYNGVNTWNETCSLF